MKKYLLTIAISVSLPLIGFAAFNDVILTTNTILSVGGITLNVAGANSTIQSITVGASSFSAVLQPGSIISVSSAAGKVLSTDAPVANISGSECTAAGVSKLTLSVPSDATTAVTVVVTPSSSACSGSATSATSGGGGTNGAPGGGGGGSTYVAPITPAVPATPASPAVPPSFSGSGTIPATPATPAIPAVVFKKIISVGATHSDVKKLQQILNSDPDTRVSASGAGSIGKETNFFGPATKKAIQKFQVKHGIAKPGQSGYGTLGPKTRAKLNELSAKGSVSAQTINSSISSSATDDVAKQLNDSMKLLQSLQEQLKALK